MSGQKLFGRASLYVDGQFYDTLPGASIRPGGIKNTSRTSTHGVDYSQSLLASEVTCQIPVRPGTSVKTLQEMAGVEIHFNADTGQNFIVRNAAQTADVVVSDGDSGGAANCVFNGPPADEVING